MIERVNISEPTIIEISSAEVVEWYKLDVPGPGRIFLRILGLSHAAAV
jgi:hypothetical protein